MFDGQVDPRAHPSVSASIVAVMSEGSIAKFGLHLSGSNSVNYLDGSKPKS